LHASSKAFLEEALASGDVPAETYAGADKEELRALVRAAWEKRWPEDKIVAVRLPVKDWERTVKETYDEGSKSWEKTDKQFLVVHVVVERSEKVVEMIPAFVNRDNLSGSQSAGVDNPGLYVVRHALRAKFSP